MAGPDELASALRAASRGADPGLTRRLVDAARADPMGDPLGDVVRSALSAGVAREDILLACNAARLEIRTAAGGSRHDEDPAEDHVLDLMDRVAGWCHPDVRL